MSVTRSQSDREQYTWTVLFDTNLGDLPLMDIDFGAVTGSLVTCGVTEAVKGVSPSFASGPGGLSEGSAIVTDMDNLRYTITGLRQVCSVCEPEGLCQCALTFLWARVCLPCWSIRYFVLRIMLPWQGVDYWVRVSAANAVGFGSPEQSTPPNLAPFPLPASAPRGVSVSSHDAGSIDVSWSAPATNGGR